MTTKYTSLPQTYAFSIEEFCRTHNMSRAMYYQLVKAKRGPKIFRVGKKPLISTESAAEWRARMEAETENAATVP